MKLATWNCCGALHKKRQKVLSLEAGLLVIQECSQADVEEFDQSDGWSFWWIGSEATKKGLGVIAKSPWAIRDGTGLPPKWTGKVVIDGPAVIELFPVWAHKSENPAAEYIEQVHLLLDIVEKTPISQFTIIAGDFNSNPRWDKAYKRNHSIAVERFGKLGMKSAYHDFFGVAHGDERLHPTLWFRKNKDNPYHVDYIFLTGQLLAQVKNVTVGCCDDWLSSSDHAPLLIEFDLKDH